MKAGEAMEYPCKECTNTPDPEGCNRKNCGDWKHWFLDEWAKINAYYERYKKEKDDGKL